MKEIATMANFEKIISHLTSFPFDKQKNHRKGKFFENIACKFFLENDPAYASLLKKVWLWKDWPKNWGKDKGIDLIAETHDGKIWAIQAKAYDENYYVTKEDVDKFLSESSRKAISFRLLIATTNLIGPNAREVISGSDEKPVALCLLNKLEASTVDWSDCFKSSTAFSKKTLKKPREHQEQALQNILTGFENSSYGQLHMACATGKTLVGLWLAERLQSNITLVLVPSISLISQLSRVWADNCSDTFKFYPLFVCSDETVGDKDDDTGLFSEQVVDLGFPVTTNAEELFKALSAVSGAKVVFSTYHSSPVLKEACDLDKDLNFDLAIADEAHRCAGKASSDFATIVEKGAIRVKHKLFMTATPRIFSDNVKNKTRELEYEIVSMDEPERFGPVFYKLSLSEAIKKGLVSDYQVLISITDNKTYREYAEKGRFVAFNNYVTDARTLASQLSVIKAIKKYDLKKMITFHGRTKSAREFVNTLPEAMSFYDEQERPEIGFKNVVFGTMLQSERIRILKQFKESSEGCSLLGNVKCLSEGVDVPELDAITFIDPKGSENDIVQAVGRVVRRPHNSFKKIGTIIIPVVIDSAEDEQEILEQSCFQKVWRVIKALRAHDDVLAEEIDSFRLQIGMSSIRKPLKLTKIIIDAPEKIDRSFSDGLEIRLMEKIIERCSSLWNYQYFLLKEYRCVHPDKWPVSSEEFPEGNRLGVWCISQRQNYRKKSLEKWQISALKNIGFEWKPFDNEWQKQFLYLKDFRHIHPDKWPMRHEEFPGGNNLGDWLIRQRRAYKKDQLEEWQILQLNSIEVEIDPIKDVWNKQFTFLEGFRCAFLDRWPKSKEMFPKGNNLGAWCDRQREFYKKDRLEDWKVLRLKNIGFEFELRSVFWNKQFSYLDEFRRVNPNRWPAGRDNNWLCPWCSKQRQAYKKNKLEKWQIAALKSINFQWDPFDDEWQRKFLYLEDFRRINPGRWPERSEEFPSGNKLGVWCSRQRARYKKNDLLKERIERLESIGFVW